MYAENFWVHVCGIWVHVCGNGWVHVCGSWVQSIWILLSHPRKVNQSHVLDEDAALEAQAPEGSDFLVHLYYIVD